MNEDFKAIKDQIRIENEIPRITGIPVKKEGSGFSIPTCPFCGHKGSCKLDTAKQTVKCFSCGFHGDIFEFYQKYRSASKHEALVDLANLIGHPLHDAGPSGAELLAMDAKSQIFEATAKYYTMVLLNDPKALAYQTDVRGHPIAALKSLEIGFSNNGLLDELLKQGFNQEDILKSGLIVPDKKRGGHRDYFFPGGYGLYVYPHRDIRGRVSDFTTKDPKKKYNFRLSKQFRKDGAPFLNMGAFKGNEVLIVEGENDYIAVHGRGKYPHVVATTGQLSQKQIDYLLEWATGSGTTKSIILAFDNDEAGRKYEQRIKDALIYRCYPDKFCEINEQLRKRQTNNLADDDADASGDNIPMLKQLVLKTLQFDKGNNDIDDWFKGRENPGPEFDKLIKQARRHLAPLAPLLRITRAWHKTIGQKDCKDVLGEIVFDWFFAQGGFFVQGEEHKLFYENKIYEIGNKSAFKSLLYNVCGLNYADNSTKNILEVVKARAYLLGRHTNGMGWIHTDLKKPAIYIDLHNESNTILKISPGSVETIQNGANDDQVLVEASPMMAGLNYIPNVNVKEAMGKAYDLIFKNLACSDSNRFYIMARAMCFVLTEYTNARGITKFSGNQGCGKSLAARLISYLIIGEDCLSKGSVASYRSEAIKAPFIFPDNLEQANMTNETASFLITSATGAINQKRDSNTSSGNVYELNKTHIITTSIEPFIKSELGSRTIDIQFKPEFRNEQFPGETLLKTQIERNRPEIISAWINILAHDVLPTYEQDQAEIYRLLNLEKKGHAKERLNEILGCLYLLCNQIAKYIPHNEYTGDGMAFTILEDWIIEQEELTRETQQDADPILYRMEALLAECSHLNKDGFVEAYGIRDTQIVTDIGGQVLEVNFIATAKELCTAFSVLSKNKNIQNPFTSPSVLMSRFKNSIGVLENVGWEVEINHKMTRGYSKHLLGKKNGPGLD